MSAAGSQSECKIQDLYISAMHRVLSLCVLSVVVRAVRPAINGRREMLLLPSREK